jgi:predicted transcriptional regulator
MVERSARDKLSIYIPRSKLAQQPVERLVKLSKKLDRSVNYLVVEAILDYLDREETKK